MANREIIAPTRKRRMLVFDVETTGKLPKVVRGQPPPPISEHPHILQLSFVVYDLAERTICRKFDSYVNVSADIEISSFITELTGIDRAKCDTGMNIVDVLEAFYEAYMWCDGLVAHNIEFDTKMIGIELVRHREAILSKAPYCLTIFNTVYEKMNSIERYCTMKKGTKLCGLEHTGPKPSRFIVDGSSNLNPVLAAVVEQEIPIPTVPVRQNNKWPKLTELHEKLFGELPAVSHDAMADTLACLRCYLKIRHGYDIGNLAH
jgi:DNA polymerase III epsilon subunit-like protein